MVLPVGEPSVCRRRIWNQGKATFIFRLSKKEFAAAEFGIKAKHLRSRQPAVTEFAAAEFGIKAKRLRAVLDADE